MWLEYNRLITFLQIRIIIKSFQLVGIQVEQTIYERLKSSKSTFNYLNVRILTTAFLMGTRRRHYLLGHKCVFSIDFSPRPFKAFKNLK